MASGFEMRVGHAERDAVATELREHYAAGRITLDELNERLDKAFAAKTRTDLNALMTDLPSATGSGTGSTTGSGPRVPLAAGAAGWDSGQGSGWGTGCGRGARRAGMAFGAVLTGLILVAALLTLGSLSLFGIGTGRPFGIVLILAALAFLRRIFFRRGLRRGPVRGRGPRRRW